MKADISSSTKKKRRFTVDDARSLAFTFPKEYNKYVDLFDSLKATDDSRPYVSKSISFRVYELGFVRRFLDENNLTIGELVKYFFYEAGAFPDAALAVILNRKTSSIFMNIDPAKWTYESRKLISPDGELVDADKLPYSFHEFEYIHDEGTNSISFNLHPFQSALIDQYLDVSDYGSMTAFVKSKLLEHGIYPTALEKLLSKVLTPKWKKKVKGRAENAGGTYSVSISRYEDALFDNLISYVEVKSPTIANKSRLVKYALVELGIIGDMKRYPIKKAMDDLDLIQKEYDASFDYSNGVPVDRSDKDVEVARYRAFPDAKVSLALSFTKSDLEKVKNRLEVENKKEDSEVKAFMKKHGKEGTVFFTDLIRCLVFDKTYHIYPNDMIKDICVTPSGR